MKKFRVLVDGTAYEVQVEETSAGGATAPIPRPTQAVASAAKPAPAPAASQPAEAAPAAASAGDAGKIVSPMPGTVWEMIVKVGQDVTPGTVLMILEAMKMENEIVTTVGGKVTDIHVQKGDVVDTGTLMITIS